MRHNQLVVVPPINFSLVARGIYRSGHPNKKNFGFLKRLNLKCIIYVEGEQEYRKDSFDFVNAEKLQLYQFNLSKEKDLFTPSGAATIHAVLAILLDTRNHPVLIHDDSGKSTATLLCSLIRRIQGWSLTGVYAEGDMFAGPAGGMEGGGVGQAGREFIAMFEPKKLVVDKRYKPEWVD
ncbi:hypothetical protein P7C73_g3813, partial [Tremellales sp. Uapishka_1]